MRDTEHLVGRIEQMKASIQQSKAQEADAMQRLAAADAELAALNLTVESAEATAIQWDQQASTLCGQVDQILAAEGL